MKRLKGRLRLSEDYNSERLLALAKYLDIDSSEIEEVDENDFETPDGEYLVLTEQEATERAKDEVKLMFDDLGLEAFTPDFREEIINDFITDEAIDNFIDEEIDYYSTQEDDEDKLSELQSLLTREEKLYYIKSVFGDINDFIKEGDVDIDAVADEAIAEDGIGHFISYYDGDEIKLTNNLFAYRIN